MFLTLLLYSGLLHAGARVEQSSGKVDVSETAQHLKVDTGTTGKALIVLDDGTSVHLGPSSSFTVEDSKPTASVTKLLYGKLRAAIPKGGDRSSWKMHSGAVAMGVRGTEFVLEKDDSKSKLCTLDGEVELANGAQKLGSVKQGQGVVFSDEGASSRPLAMDSRQIEWWNPDSLKTRSTSFWRWGEPPAVQTLDPAYEYRDGHHWHLGGSLYGRALDNHKERHDLTGRGSLNAYGVAAPNFYGYADILFYAKTGKTNSEPGAFQPHQMFFVYRPHPQHQLSLGLQEWDFGSGLIVGKDPWSSKSRSFQGATYILRTPKVRITTLSASLNDRVDEFYRYVDSLHGFYGEVPKANFDFNLLWMSRNGPNEFTSYNLGEHKWTGLGPFFVDEELELQNLQKPDMKKTWATLAHLQAGAAAGDTAFDPMLKLGVLNATGYEQVFPDSHRFLGLVNALGPIRDIRKVSMTASMMKFEIETSSFTRLLSNQKLGNELDLQWSTDLTPRLHARFGWGRFWKTTDAAEPQSSTLGFVLAEYRL